MNAILVAEDADERALLTAVLQRVGLSILLDGDFDHALREWPGRPADLALVATGGELTGALRRLRGLSAAPVVVLTDGGDEAEQVRLLEAGADLVIARPYSSRLLVAQLRALMRRSSPVPSIGLPSMRVGNLSLDPATRVVTVTGGPQQRLTQLEFRLLYTLMLHRGQILPPDAIVEQVWGYTAEGNRDLVRSLVNRLRAKVEVEPRHPHYILTIPGAGYAFGVVDPEA